MGLRYLLSALLCVSSFALTIDNFDGDSSTSAGPFQVQKSSFNHSSAVGGSRKYTVNGLTGSSILQTRISTSLGFLSHSQDAGASGISRIDWDATTDLNTLKTNGLGSIDFTQDGSDAIKIDVLSFDYPNQNSVRLKVYLYSPNGASSAELELNQAISTKTSFLIPFNSFSAVSGNAVDFTKVGAASLEVWGLDDDIDLRLEWFGTNSPCTLIPDSNGRVVDECGVCGGDNSSCSDCLGVPHGTSLPGTTCQNGEQGVCAGGVFNNSCACIRNNNPTSDICDGLDNDCDGQADEDFSEKNTACSVGTGLCKVNGTFLCSVSGGIMCSASTQQAQVDACESSKGCDGVPNSGLVFDQCGVCGGNNASCSDCAGVPNGTATIDRCGVCSGDGLSCLACSEGDQKPLLVKLDGLAKQQQLVVKQALARLVALTGTKNKVYAAKLNLQANTIKNASWSIVWQQLPSVTKICSNREFCKTISNLPVIEKYRYNSDVLKKFAQDALRRLAKVKGTSKTVKTLSALATKLHANNLALTNQVPLSQSNCD